MAKKEEKAEIINRLQDDFSKCSIAILTDYRGMSTQEMTVLRRRLGESGTNYKVVKNTLAQLAAGRAGKDNLGSSFEGPVAIALGYGDIVEPARVLTDHIRALKVNLDIKGGFLGDRLLTLEDINTLSSLPSRKVLLARVLGGMQGPILALVNCLANPIRGISGVLQARIKQLEGE